MIALFKGIGQSVITGMETSGRLTQFVWSAIHQGLKPPLKIHHYTQQMLKVGVGSMPIANLTALFVGMVITLQTGYQLMHFGAKLYSAGVTGLALTREMIPVFTAMVVGARVAASIAAELGTMKVTEQIDAMEALAVSPLRYLVAPRIVASTIMLPVLTIYANLVGFIGGMIIGLMALGISPQLYLSYTLSFVGWQDFYAGMVKTVFFGALIGIIGCYCGFQARGGAEGVGRATTSSVVFTLVFILIFDYILTTWTMLFTGLMGA